MRKRINRAALCSSENYKASKRVHLAMLEERHSHFCNFTVYGEMSFDVPILKDGSATERFKTIRVFGKDIKVTVKEFRTHCADFK